MIKVCLVSPYSYKLFHQENENLPPFGGAEVQQYLLGKELAEDENFNISFIVGNFYKEQPKQEEINLNGHVINLYKTIKCKNRNCFLDFVMDFWFLYQGMKNTSADIFIIRGGGSLAGKVAIVTKYLLKKIYIYSSAHDRESDSNFSKINSWLVNTLFMYALNNADTVICQHQDQQKKIQQNLKIDATVFKTMYPLNKELLLFNPSLRGYILWVGRLVDFKQPELFFNLAKHFPKEKFLLISNSDKTILEETIKNHNNVEILKNVPFEKMDDYFRKAKIFVNTSTQEGFPNTFVQAAKNGVPICSLNVNPDGMLDKYNIGYCATGEMKKLINNATAILHDTDKWQRMSQDAFKYAEENHNIKSIVKEYKLLFKTLYSQQCG